MRNRNWLLVISLAVALPIFAQQASSPTSHVAGNGSAAHKNTSSPSLAQILDWMKDKLQSDSTTDRYYADPHGGEYANIDFLHTIMESINGCRFDLVETETEPEMKFASGVPHVSRTKIRKTAIDLSKLRSDIKVVSLNLGDGFRTPIYWVVEFYAVDESSALQTTTTLIFDGETGSPEVARSVGQYITLPNKDLADRIAKALGDAIAKCGGKKVKELY